MSTILPAIVTALALALVPPWLVGAVRRTKALAAGRTGPSLWQPHRDLVKLLRKELALSATTTWVFVLAPVVGRTA